MTLEYDLYGSFRSPCSYMVTPRLLELEAQYAVRCNLRQVYPLAVRTPELFKTREPLWVRDFLTDGLREAPLLGLCVTMRSLLLAIGLALASPAAAGSLAAPPVPAEFARYATEIAAAQGRLDAFLVAFNARDLNAFEATLNFPHVRFASGTVTILQPGDMKPDLFGQGALVDWDHSDWLRRNVIHAGPDKVHINTRFARYRKDGSLIAAFDSIYIVTRQDGRWGIQGRSSYAP